jgi:hypothetical protein
VGRITWRTLRQGFAMLWGMDSRSLPYTLWQLLLRPGYLIGDYISGRRQVSFPPIKMLAIVALFALIINNFYSLCMSAALADILIGGRFLGPVGITDLGGDHPVKLVKKSLHSPKASSGKVYCLHLFLNFLYARYYKTL